MSNNTECTISDLLPTKFEQMQPAIEEEIAVDPDFSQHRLPGFVQRKIARKATEAVLEKLKKSIYTILPAAWARAPELSEYTDKTKHPPGAETTVYLGEHKFEIDHKPIVNLTIFDITRPVLHLKLVFASQIRSAAIKIRDGQIVAIGECDCFVEAELKHVIPDTNPPRETGFHLKLKSREVKLVDQFELNPPVPIVRAKQPSSPQVA